ncbi:MAG TPA: hypothetical protein EYP51_05950 [Thiotrichales bacterium]|nr:hypothetical protein [Thiotrichales bacterium]
MVVEMKMFLPDLNQRLGYVKAIADADVVLSGEARNIYYYNPSNKLIAQADQYKGVRLVD